MSSRPIQTSTKSGSLPFGAEKHRRKNVPVPEDISDDELANDETKQRGRTKPQTSSNSTKSRTARLGPKMRLRQAVTKSHIFQPETDLELVPNGSGTGWGVAKEDGKFIGFPWLQLDAKRMNKIYHSPDSEVVVVYWPQTQSIPSTLVLKFEDKQASHQFRLRVEEASGTVKSEPKEP